MPTAAEAQSAPITDPEWPIRTLSRKSNPTGVWRDRGDDPRWPMLSAGGPLQRLKVPQSGPIRIGRHLFDLWCASGQKNPAGLLQCVRPLPRFCSIVLLAHWYGAVHFHDLHGDALKRSRAQSPIRNGMTGHGARSCRPMTRICDRWSPRLQGPRTDGGRAGRFALPFPSSVSCGSIS